MCPEAASASDPVGPAEPDGPNEALEILAEGAIRTNRAKGGEEESERATEHEDSHQDAAPRRGTVSCRR